MICGLRGVNESDLNKLLKLHLTVETLSMLLGESDISFRYMLIWSPVSYSFREWEGEKEELS